MASNLPGCLMLPLLPLRAIGVLGGSAKQLPLRPALQTVAWERLDSEDRPAIQRARATCEACLAGLAQTRGDLGAPVADQVAAEVIGLFSRLVSVGEELARARRFVRENDPEAIARQRADIEVKLVGASLVEKTALDATLASMRERGRHASTVNGEVGVLQARLLSTVASLETLSVRLQRASLSVDERSARVSSVLAELARQQHDAERALEAYAATAREIAQLGG